MAKRTTRKRTTGNTSRKTARTATAAKRPAARSAAPRKAARSSGAAANKAAKSSGTTRGSRTTPATPARKVAERKVAERKVAPRKMTGRKVTGRKSKAGEPSALGKAATAVRGTVAGAVAAVRRTVSRRPPDALALLENDHRRVQKLLKQGEKTGERAAGRRAQLLETLTAELRAHELIEERVLYPALEEQPEAREVALEGFQEHHVVNVIIEELHRVAADEEQWGAKFSVLKENLEHHIEEEEGEMFRTARGLFSQEELDAMGAKMAAIKAEQARR